MTDTSFLDGRTGRRVPLLPQLLPTGNLAAGFCSITLSFEGSVAGAAFAIVCAGLFDVLDGRVARLTRSTSRFGMEYDSLADCVSFGVAPAILAFTAGALHELGWIGWVLAFFYTACATVRLARFNVTPGRYAGCFDGLASMAAAGTVLSAVLVAEDLRTSGLALAISPSQAGLGVAAVGLLMVSPLPYRSLKNVRLGMASSALVVALAIAALLTTPSVALFMICLTYVATGPVEALSRWRKGTALAESAPSPLASEFEMGEHGVNLMRRGGSRPVASRPAVPPGSSRCRSTTNPS
jgi:CDP-diacylglycerol--serine O-phosphatidyltransferase